MLERERVRVSLSSKENQLWALLAPISGTKIKALVQTVSAGVKVGGL